jgi:hypothetical protein
MAITVPTSYPKELLIRIKKDVAARQTDEWHCDADGDFTLADPQWHGKAWFRPYVKDGKLVFGIIPSTDPKMTNALFAAYHGRLLETLLGRYSHLFSETSTSDLADKFYDLL